MRKSVRTFKLNRILKLKDTSKYFVQDDNFDIDDYFGRAWATIPEGKLHNVKLKFSSKVARNAPEVHWHSTQQTTQNPDGTATVEFPTDGLNEISW